jgi:anaerobic ribonucleoside-triphosphate reductase
MTSEKGKFTLTEDSLFEAVLDSACERLEDKQAEYSIRRLREMDTQLGNLEKELDDLIQSVCHENSA